MIVFSFFSLITSMVVFFLVRLFLFQLMPTGFNVFAFDLLVMLISFTICSFIFALRDFRNSPNGRLKNKEFHRHFFKTLSLNLLIGTIITLLMGGF